VINAMKKALKNILSIGLLSLLALTGCDAEAEQIQENPLEPIPPHLYVFLEPEQAVRTIGLGISWTVFDEGGNFLIGFHGDSHPPPGQLRPEDFYSATLHLPHGQDTPVDWRFVDMDFTYGYPPNTYSPYSISVTRWRILDYLGNLDVEYEAVEVGDMVPIFDDGHDYIYAAEVEWREGRSRGRRYFVFRVKSGINLERND